VPVQATGSVALSTFTIRVAGSAIPGSYGVLSLDIVHEIGRIPYAHLVLQDGDTAEQTFAISESDTFVPGAEIEIDLGYDREEQTVFRGVVVRQRIDAPGRGASRLHVEALHPCYRMARGRRSRAWVDVTDADAIGDLAADRGIAFDGSSTTRRPQLFQHQASDWDFAVLRSERIGQLLSAEPDGLRMFHAEPTAAPGLDLEYGINLFSFNLELDAADQAEQVEVGAWNPADQALIEGDAAAEDVPGPGNLSGGDLADVSDLKLQPRHPGMRDQAELDEWADAEMLRRRLAAIIGSVEAQGSAALRPGATVRLKGMGARFNGTAFVSGLRHALVRGDWRTHIQVGLDPRFHNERHEVSAPPAAGLAPAISGLQVGIVSQLEGDPAGEERVAVRLATETETSEPIWARVMAVGGGPERGLIMLPEVGDECLLGFLDGDPRDPILLGGLYSSAAASPIRFADDNHRKGTRSRAGMQILFDDDDVAVALDTPAGRHVTLSDGAAAITLQDDVGNTVTLDDDGITLATSGDLVLRAGGDITLEGRNVKASARAQADLEGAAGASLTSSSQTVVKGAVVMIN